MGHLHNPHQWQNVAPSNKDIILIVLFLSVRIAISGNNVIPILTNICGLPFRCVMGH